MNVSVTVYLVSYSVCVLIIENLCDVIPIPPIPEPSARFQA
jgi:hypothetical protein